MGATDKVREVKVMMLQCAVRYEAAKLAIANAKLAEAFAAKNQQEFYLDLAKAKLATALEVVTNHG